MNRARGSLLFRLGTDPVFVCLVGIFLLALALRFYGIRWGLPNDAHPLYSYHPDEALHLFLADWFAQGKIVPKHFMYGGTLYFALLNAISHVAEFIQPVLGEKQLLPATILFGRYIQVFLALATIVLTYLTGSLLLGSRVGVLAALFLTIAPAHIFLAQQLRPDQGGAFLVAVIAYLAAKMVRGDVALTKYCAYSGVILGLATSLRFPLAAFGVMPVAALFLVKPEMSWRDRFGWPIARQLGVLLACTVASFLVANPQLLAHPDVFLAGIEVQWRYQSGPFPDAVDVGPGLLQHGWSMLHQALGFALYFLVAAGIGFALWRRTAADLILLSGSVSYIVLTSFASWVVVRYTLPVLPLLVILAARMIDEIHRVNGGRVMGRVALTAVMAWTIAGDMAYLRLTGGRDVRDVTSDWLSDNIQKGATLLLVKTYLEDDFFNPVVPQDISSSVLYLQKGADVQKTLNGKQRYDYFVLHEYVYRNMERLGDRHPLPEVRDLGRELAASRYRITKEFKTPTVFLGIDFSASFSANDYTLVNPGIRIYRYDG